jgi:signal transduction histidine kinase
LDLRETVDRTVNMFSGTKQAKSRSITVASDGAWPWIEADERAIRQMLLNLLSNAAKFSEPHTAIEVRCRFSSEGDVVLTVADHGIGMTSQEAAQVVNAFYQADSRMARRYEGTGLGLSIVSGLMSCHGGRLTIDSEPGLGSRISLIFPPHLVCANDLIKVA